MGLEHELTTRSVAAFIETYPGIKSHGWDAQYAFLLYLSLSIATSPRSSVIIRPIFFFSPFKANSCPPNSCIPDLFNKPWYNNAVRTESPDSSVQVGTGNYNIAATVPSSSSAVVSSASSASSAASSSIAPPASFASSASTSNTVASSAAPTTSTPSSHSSSATAAAQSAASSNTSGAGTSRAAIGGSAVVGFAVVIGAFFA
jgi:hypothetical protein